MQRSRLGWMLVLAAAAAAACWPVFDAHWFSTHERSEYVTRTVQYAEALGRGELYPRWAPDLYGGYGSPFFNFYAPLVYSLAGIFTHLVGSPVLALKLVVLLGSVLAGLATFALIHAETRRRDAAFVGACLYLAAPYRLAEVSWRGDLAEFLALGILPLTLLAYRRIVHEPDAARLPAAVLLAALSHAALVLAHTLSGLWGTGFIAVLALLSAWQLRRREVPERARLLAVAFVGALLLSALYTLPALGERGLVRTETMTQGWAWPGHHWLLPRQLFEPGPYHVGPVLAAAAGLCACAALVRRRVPLAALPWLAAALALTALTLPHAQAIWRLELIPFGSYIQFPWRLLGPAVLAASVACGLAWAELLPARGFCELLVAPVAALAVLFGRPHTALEPYDACEIALSGAEIRESAIKGTDLDEYLPRVVASAPTAAASKVARSSRWLRVKVERSAGTSHRLGIEAKRAGKLELALHAFPGWRVQSERGPVPKLGTSPRGLVQLELPEQGSYRVLVELGWTRAQRAAFVLFLLGLVGVHPVARLVVRRSLAPLTGTARDASRGPLPRAAP